jgi:hypothetical protein
MQSSTELDLAAKIRQLQADRQRHAEAIAAIDRVLNRVGDALAADRATAAAARPANPAGDASQAPPATPATDDHPGKRRRGKFAQTADRSVLDFIRQKGEPSTAEINAHWRAEGRLGTSNVTLLKLLKSGLVRRVEDPSVRGSRYVLADAPSPATAAHESSN